MRHELIAGAAVRVGDDLPAARIGHTVLGLLVVLREALRRGDVVTGDADRLLRDPLTDGIAAR